MNKSKKDMERQDSAVKNDTRHNALEFFVIQMKNHKASMGVAYNKKTSLDLGKMALLYGVVPVARVYKMRAGFVREWKNKAQEEQEKESRKNVATAAAKFAEASRDPVFATPEFVAPPQPSLRQMGTATLMCETPDPQSTAAPDLLAGKTTMDVTPEHVTFGNSSIPGLTITLPSDSEISVRAVGRAFGVLLASIKK